MRSCFQKRRCGNSRVFASGRAGFVPPKIVISKLPSVIFLTLFPELVLAWAPLPSLTDPIRQEIKQVEAELRTLPVTPINTSPWTLGYSSKQDEPPELPLQVEIRFPEPETIDLVALIPATYTDDQNELNSFGFPVRFSIERILPNGTVQMIANHLEAAFPAPGIEPQLFPCPDPVPTAGLRITVTERAPNATWWRASHIVALSELFAFDGDRNVALNAPVEASSSFEFSYVWSPTCLTDGFSQFSPIDHSLTNPMKNFSELSEEVILKFDLGKTFRIDEFRLWPVVHSIQHNFPPSSGIGFPQFIRLEVATNGHLADAEVVYEAEEILERPGAGPFMHGIRPTEARFIRLTLRDGLPDFRRKERVEIALSEIEFLESGKVVSKGVPARTPRLDTSPPGLNLLTDGNSNEGEILPLRLWVTQFKRRVELERKLGTLLLGLDTAQRKEENRARTLLLIALVLIAALLQLVWLVRSAARRRWAKMRERIACDLHDEIGANVSSIAHTAELLDETITRPSDTQTRLLGNLIASARLTSRETKHFVRFIEGEDQDRDLTEQFGRVAGQILSTIPVTASFENTRSFNRLDPSTKWNLLLFYKEALNNIIKHAGATAVEITARRTGSRMQLLVADNGRGLPENVKPCRHLESRAKMLGGRLEIRSRPGEGTRINLIFKGNHHK